MVKKRPMMVLPLEEPVTSAHSALYLFFRFCVLYHTAMIASITKYVPKESRNHKRKGESKTCHTNSQTR